VLKVRFAGFETHTAQKRVHATNDEAVLLESAKELAAPFLRAGRPVRLVGLRVKDLVPDWGQKTLGEFTGE
jgi:nucleotidyltransferase/DNA polymerase involved in DNA repair